MLTEEALILLATLGAAALLVIGVLELVWPARRREHRRTRGLYRRAAPPATVPRPETATPALRPEPGPMPMPAAETVALESDAEREVVAVPPARQPGPTPVAMPLEFPPTATVTPEPAVPSAPDTNEEPEPTAFMEDRAAALVATIERCRELYDEGRFADVATLATEAIAASSVGTVEAGDVSQLWSLVARARQALGDHEGAHGAFESALATADPDDRPRYERELAAFAVRTARELVGRSRDASEDDERLEALRAARALIVRVRQRLGDDPLVDEAVAEVDDAYWPAFESAVRKLIADEAMTEAYRLATEALADPDLPAERRAGFEQVRAETLTAEIGRLTGLALTAMEEGRDWDAVGSLERAERLQQAVMALPLERRDEANRQLWWAYTRLGTRRVDAGEFEDALDPLFRALRLSPSDPARRDETRSAMVTALRGVVQNRAATIREVASLGNHESAVIQAERLWTLLRSGIATGVPQEGLADALTVTRALLEDLGETPR